MMRHNELAGCLTMVASNEELSAWLAADPASDQPSAERLFGVVAPLLIAYFDGQLQGPSSDIEGLALQTMIELYRQRSRQIVGSPLRAWMMGLARAAVLRYRQEGRVRPIRLATGTDEELVGDGRDTARELHDLASSCIRAVRCVPMDAIPGAAGLGAYA